MSNVATRLCFCLLVSLIVSAGHAEPLSLVPDPNAHDPIYQELNQLISEQTNCFKRESMSRKLAKVDLETAAYAVLAACSPQTEKYRRYMAGHFPGQPPQFEQWWSEKEIKAKEVVKKIIALVRTM